MNISKSFVVHAFLTLISATSLVSSSFQSSPAPAPLASVHAVLGDPVRREVVFRRAGYDVTFDGCRKNPSWTQYRVVPDDLVPRVERPGRFYTDRALPKVMQVENDDYRSGGGYDRGHLVPAADMRRTLEIANESMLFSNICPMTPELNRNAWREIESYVRKRAMECDETFVATGPLYDELHCAMGFDDGLMIPSGFWKAAAFHRNGGWTVQAWTAGQNDGDRDPQSLQVPLRNVEQLSGFELFSGLDLSSEYKRAIH